MIHTRVVLGPHVERHWHSEALQGTDEETIIKVKWTAQSKWQIRSQNIVNAFATTQHHISCLAFQTFFLLAALSAAAAKTFITYIYVTAPIKKSFHNHYHIWSSQKYIIHICQMRELKFREINILAWNFYIMYIWGKAVGFNEFWWLVSSQMLTIFFFLNKTINTDSWKVKIGRKAWLKIKLNPNPNNTYY